MEKLGLDLDDGSSPADAKQANPQVRFLSENLIIINFLFLNLILFHFVFRKRENSRFKGAYNLWSMLVNAETQIADCQVVKR